MGLHLQFPGFISAIPFNNAKQYQDYIARLKQIPLILEQGIQLAKQGQKDGLMPPKYLIEKVAKQITSIATPAGRTVFCFSIKAISKNISKAEQERLSREVLQTIDQYVLLCLSKTWDVYSERLLTPWTTIRGYMELAKR